MRHSKPGGRKTKLPFSRLVGAVSNCAYSVLFLTAPTGWRKCVFIFRIYHKRYFTEIAFFRFLFAKIGRIRSYGELGGVDDQTFINFSCSGHPCDAPEHNPRGSGSDTQKDRSC